ncbi:hypothetical protein K488DRAFT_92149 [Vararia minispora EC-137]|uniref:Uncharacterized protein n=1 Tax=Vararia minispora EC-137 TaxID=1314806 RepID=A0ACB8Q4G3_9AGAM|nr:hypothetical protein K488DRAFT_92149 [Vararia minispora EC-137]
MYPALRYLLPSIQAMGSEHSDDESDHEGDRPLYKVSKQAWRSVELDRFLRLLDLLYLRSKFKSNGVASPGTWPRRRVSSGQVIPGTVLIGLPTNFYDLNWMKNLDASGLRELDIRDHVSLEPPFELKVLAAATLGIVTRPDGGRINMADIDEQGINKRQIEALEAYLMTGMRCANARELHLRVPVVYPCSLSFSHEHCVRL